MKKNQNYKSDSLSLRYRGANCDRIGMYENCDFYGSICTLGDGWDYLVDSSAKDGTGKIRA